MQTYAGVLSPDLLRDFRRLRAKGLTYKAISKELGIKPFAAVTLGQKARMKEH